MSLDLGAVNARLDRANAHADELEQLLREYSARAVVRQSVVARDRPERRIERLDLVERLPAATAMVVSVAVHQSRAALDNLVTALRGRSSAATYFPITPTTEDFDRVAPTALAGVPTWAVDVIRRMQPGTMDPRAFVGDWELETLHELARIDRHRAPPLQTAFLLPMYAAHAGSGHIEMRGDQRTWAEVEYDQGTVTDVRFRFEVRFADEVPRAGHHEVVALTRQLVGTVANVLEVLGRRGR